MFYDKVKKKKLLAFQRIWNLNAHIQPINCTCIFMVESWFLEELWLLHTACCRFMIDINIYMYKE